jgi:Phosphotransferase enzyme family
MLPWSQPGWLDDVIGWIDSAAERTGPVEELHKRAWSAMLLVPTFDGPAYFKASAPGLVHEAALTEALARWRPDCTVKLLAVDAGRGWMLMRDSGETMRGVLEREPAVERLEPLFARYAGFQLELVPHRDEFLALGVPDRRLTRLAELAKALPVDEGLVRDLVGTIESYGLPETIVHEEVHAGNVLVRDGELVFVDWADSCFGHPFFGVVVALRSVADRFELAPGARELDRLADAYLEPWTAIAPRKALRALFPAAYRLGMLNRALSWNETVKALDPPLYEEYASFVSAWVDEFEQAVQPEAGT